MQQGYFVNGHKFITAEEEATKARADSIGIDPFADTPPKEAPEGVAPTDSIFFRSFSRGCFSGGSFVE
jgi:hypothetical protein